MSRSIQEILDHADELARLFEHYEPSESDDLAICRAAWGRGHASGWLHKVQETPSCHTRSVSGRRILALSEEAGFLSYVRAVLLVIFAATAMVKPPAAAGHTPQRSQGLRASPSGGRSRPQPRPDDEPWRGSAIAATRSPAGLPSPPTTPPRHIQPVPPPLSTWSTTGRPSPLACPSETTASQEMSSTSSIGRNHST